MYIQSKKAIPRPFALNDEPYYPLIHVRPLNPNPELRTRTQIRDYRLKNGLPSVLDQWIEKGRFYTKPPACENSLNKFRDLKYILWSDKVECQLSVTVKKGLVEGIFCDPDSFSLNLKLYVPLSAGFLAYYSESPKILVAEYTGEKGGALAPGWIHAVDPTAKFWQPRPMMLDFMIHFATSLPENEKVQERVCAWCRAISVPCSGLSTSIWGRKHFEPLEPKNTRGRKCRASDMCPDESQRLREHLNKGSPLRGDKSLNKSNHE